jgi:galactonate dehydratase
MDRAKVKGERAVKVIAIDTIQLTDFPNLLWVHVRTDEGIVGLGETFFGPGAVAAYIHESVAPYLLGQDPLKIDLHARSLVGYLGFKSTGAESRGNSAIDIALWDILGQVTDQPIYQLLGGLSRDRVRTYNTCAGYEYTRARPTRQRSGDWGLPEDESTGPYEDMEAFLHRADELAVDLLEQGITGMKIWPFDGAAYASGGLYISGEELDRALEPFRKIRNAVGNKMDIMVELHSLWNLPTAIKIAEALEEFSPFWYEDPIQMNNLDALRDYARRTRVPVCASETLNSRWAFRELFEKQAVGVAMLDLSWAGGISEAKKIATMAEAYQLPIAPHDCTGPVVFNASVHLSVNAPNALIQESVRAFYSSWYQELVDEIPEVKDGYITPLTGPGLGMKLQDDVPTRESAIVQRSSLE